MKKLTFIFALVMVLLMGVQTSFAAEKKGPAAEWEYLFSIKLSNGVVIDTYCDLPNVELSKDGILTVWTANSLSQVDESGVSSFLIRYAFDTKKNKVRKLASMDLNAKDELLAKDPNPTEWADLTPKEPAAEILRLTQEKMKKK